jgi:sugar diacid utilization regulator
VAGTEVLGRLVLTRDGAPRPADVRVLERGAVVTALLLLFNRHLAEVANRGRRDLLEGLLNGSVTDPDEVSARAADLDAELGGELVLVVCAVQGHRADAEQAASFYAGHKHGLSARVDGHLVFLIPGADAGTLARDASAWLGRVLGSRVTAAGEPLPTGGPMASTVTLAHRKALDSLAALHALGREGQGASMAELGFIGVLLSAGDTGSRFVADTIGPLLDYDRARGSELVATLAAWFGAGGHLGRTATALHVHVNTVAQRLTRIGKLLGPDWCEPGRALELQMALQLHGLLHGR